MQDDATCDMEFKARLAMGMNAMTKTSKMWGKTKVSATIPNSGSSWLLCGL